MTKPVSPIFEQQTQKPGFSEFVTEIRIGLYEWRAKHRLFYGLIKIALGLAILGVLFLGTAHAAGQVIDGTTVTIAPEPGAMGAIIEPQAVKQPTCKISATTTDRVFPFFGPFRTFVAYVRLPKADPLKWNIEHLDYVASQLVNERFDLSVTGVKLKDYVTATEISCPLDGVTLTFKVQAAQ